MPNTRTFRFDSTIDGDDGEEIAVKVKGTASGAYTHGSLLDPPEEPEFEIEEAIDDNGVDWAETMSEENREALIEEMTELFNEPPDEEPDDD